MPEFVYVAMDAQGRRCRGRMAALNRPDLEQRLRQLGLDCIQAKLRNSWFGGRLRMAPAVVLSRRQLIHFCFHLEQLLSAGVSLLEALSDLRDSSERPAMAHCLAAVMTAIEGGASFSQALAEQPKVFSPVFIGLIRAGEHSGRLPQVLSSLLESLKWQDELAAYSRRLLIYPAVLATVIFAALAVALTQVVPELAKLLKAGGQILPLNTRILIALSDFALAYGVWLVLSLVFLALLVPVLLKTSPRLRQKLDGWKLSLPLLGPILKKIIISRFAGLLAMMYASGISILEAVKNCEPAVGNAVIRNGLSRVGEAIGQGQSLTQAFQQTGLFPPLVLRMIKLGESTGGLDSALNNVGYFYSRDVRESVARLQTLMEPLLTLVLGAVLGWVMLSTLGPIYDTMTRLRF